MTIYTAKARRWDEGWELHVEGIGVTQSPTLDSAKARVADYVETVTGCRPSHVEVIVDEVSDE